MRQWNSRRNLLPSKETKRDSVQMKVTSSQKTTSISQQLYARLSASSTPTVATKSFKSRRNSTKRWKSMPKTDRKKSRRSKRRRWVGFSGQPKQIQLIWVHSRSISNRLLTSIFSSKMTSLQDSRDSRTVKRKASRNVPKIPSCGCR